MVNGFMNGFRQKDNTLGTVTNKKTGASLHGLLDSTYDQDIWFKIDGTSATNILKNTEWEFVEDKPSVQEQFDALPIGAAFVENKKWLTEMQENFYVKVDEKRVLFVGPSTLHEVPKKFNPDETWWKEIIRKEIA